MKRRFLYSAERRGLRVATVFFCALFSALSYGLQESMGPEGSNVLAVHAEGYTGQGIHIGFLSIYNVYEDHNAFSNRVSIDNIHNIDTDISDSHDTKMAGIMISSGDSTEPNQIGAAPMAYLHNTRVGAYPMEDFLEELIVNQNCKVIVSGFQFSGTPSDFDGDSLETLIYDYYAQERNVIFANAAGNYDSDSYDYMTPPTSPGDAYNGITTGGLITSPPTEIYDYDKIGSSSLSGHTYDNRMKPDIAAPSSNQRVPTTGGVSSWTNITHTTQGFTSWSVPHTAGVAAVLLSYANSPESSEANDNQNEVIKAVIVNSAFPNIDDKSGNATTLQTWDTDRGYGRIDAKRAYDILSSPKIDPSSTTGNSKGWGFDSVAPGELDSYTIKGINNERLVITLTWNRRVVWNDSKSRFSQKGVIEPGELEAFFANLDLEIRDPDGILISPAASSIDNLEKYDLLLTKTGDYEIRVINQSGSESADYALAFELLAPLEADFNIDYVVNDLDLVDFVPHWLDTDCNNPIQPCYPYNLSGSDSIDLSDYSVFAGKWLDYDNRYYSP